MKKKYIFVVALLALFCFIPNVLANVSDNLLVAANEIQEFNFCERSEVLKVLRVLGYVIYVAKLVIPLLLIIFGSIDFGKAVLSSDDKAIKEAGGTLVRRFIAAVIVFLLPTILNLLLDLVYNYESFKENESFKKCTECIFNPNEPTSCK